MIKFFRHIRQKLLANNQLGSYLKYAIGEVLLVMAGILLAFELNNWSEQKQRDEFESEILTLIDTNLQEDAKTLEIILKESKQAMAASEQILNALARNQPIDSIEYLLGDIINFQRFRAQSSAFEVLKTRGINHVKNKDLQLTLIDYYDDVLFDTYEALNDIEKSFNNDWVPVIKTDYSDFKWKQYAQPTDPDEYFKKPSTIILIKLFQNNRDGQVEQLEVTIKKIKEIQSLIKNNTHTAPLTPPKRR